MAQNPPRYFPPNYFAGGYWSGSELPEGAMFASISAGATVTADLTTTDAVVVEAPAEIRAAGGAARGSQKHVDVLAASAVVTGAVEIIAAATVTSGRSRRTVIEDDDRVLLELVAAFLNTRGRPDNGIVV